MSDARIIDGNAFSANLRARLAQSAATLKADHGIIPGLAVVLVGDDPASQIYVRNKNKRAVEIGMQSFEYLKPAATSEADLLDLVAQLNADPAVHGILVQLPLPGHIDAQKVLNAIDPAKDVDGFHPFNVGMLSIGGPTMISCTPLGCLMLLKDALGSLAGKDAVVIGRSNIVGKPMAQLLLRENCTVTICHSRTRDLPAVVRRADIVVAAIGKADFVQGDWIKPGAAVIDVGINRVAVADGKSKVVGDVDFAAARQVAGAITPVPGGVGPMTIAVLLRNTLVAACRQHGVAVPDGDEWA